MISRPKNFRIFCFSCLYGYEEVFVFFTIVCLHVSCQNLLFKEENVVTSKCLNLMSKCLMSK